MLAASLTSALRAADRGRLLAAQFTPALARSGVLALLAFNAELGAVSWRAREPLIARIRFQWWRDNLAAVCEGRPPKHAAAEALAEACARHAVPPAALARLIDAREHAALADPPADLDEMESRARAVDGTLFALWAHVLNAAGEAPGAPGASGAPGEIEAPGAVEACAHNLGAAWGLTGAVRALPAYAAAGRPVPPADLVRGPGAVRLVCDRAAARLAAARGADVSKAARPAFLAAALLDGYLATLRRAGFDPFDARVQAHVSAPAALARMGFNAACGRF